jgi:hypothetical protein
MRCFFREILLAALLIMCNAAEKILPLNWKISRTERDSRGEEMF